MRSKPDHNKPYAGTKLVPNWNYALGKPILIPSVFKIYLNHFNTISKQVEHQFKLVLNLF